ncbi:hypothetical protein BDV96DRAFT_606842 [Lophiotrema nucula]|uniref:Uncharacterized protein n=1 Tax=Lophiotrema nucula TaxID=690887 RepID=A0A6A5YII5_9PLEO|nr:hypothetical protein BDV96DRAFT_606842 [Lophiotrema nucula]
MGINTTTAYTSFYHSPTEQRKKKFWDPTTVLDIINPSRGCLTCVGYAPTCGRRCRNPINQSNRTSAFQLLDDLSYIDVSTEDIKPKLNKLAQLTLCLRYHQNQRSDMVEQWSRKIHQTSQTWSMSSSDATIDREQLLDQMQELKERLARLQKQVDDANQFTFTTPAGQRYRTHPNPQPALEDQAKKRREQEARQATERERQQQARETRAREEKEEKRREEQQRREEEAAKVRQAREAREREEVEEKKREETRRREEQEAENRKAREREEFNERVRQRAERAKKDHERKAKEQAENEREEWDKVWLQYVLRWDELKKQDVKATSLELRELIPWPVKSGSWRGVSGPAVEEFFRQGPSPDTTAEKLFQFMKMECLRWHADRIPRMFGVLKDEKLGGLFNIVAQVAIKLRAEAAERRER